MDTIHPKTLKPTVTDPGAMDPGIANLDLSRVTSLLDDKMASAVDASIPTTAKQKTNKRKLDERRSRDHYLHLS